MPLKKRSSLTTKRRLRQREEKAIGKVKRADKDEEMMIEQLANEFQEEAGPDQEQTN